MRVRGRTNRLASTLWAAGLALLLRALLPAGLMLTPAAHGQLPQLAICADAQSLTSGFTAPGSHKSDREAPRGHDAAPCPFAGLAAPHAPQAAFRFGAPPAAVVSGWRSEDIVRDASAVTMSAPPPPSQAPPAAG